MPTVVTRLVKAEHGEAKHSPFITRAVWYRTRWGGTFTVYQCMFIHLNLSLLNPSETETLSEHHFLHDVLLARCFWVFGVLGLCFISWPLWLVSGFVEFCSSHPPLPAAFTHLTLFSVELQSWGGWYYTILLWALLCTEEFSSFAWHWIGKRDYHEQWREWLRAKHHDLLHWVSERMFYFTA